MKFVPGSGSSSWKDICIQGGKLSSGCELEFIEPVKNSEGKEYAALLKYEIDKDVSKWSSTLVGYVIGDNLFYMHLKVCVGRLWRSKCYLDIYSR